MSCEDNVLIPGLFFIEILIFVLSTFKSETGMY